MTRIQELKAQVRNARKLQYNASQMRNARGVGNMERLLEKLYREIDEIERWPNRG